jgi:uncharacterized membrane protein YkoI
MKPVALFERRSLATALVLAGAVGFAGAALAQYSQPAPAATPQPQGQAKPGATPDPHQQAKPETMPSQANATTDTKTTEALMSEKPIIPSKAEMADAAFKKLDAAGKGYVSKDDTKGLTGFDNAFQVADANHDGKLDAAEFKNAWASYTGRKS